eukprot:1063215-Rhodomonas_salina.1
MIYHGTPSTLPPDPEDPKPGLWAVRCGAYKAHFVTGCAAMHLFGDKRCAGPPGPAASAVRFKLRAPVEGLGGCACSGVRVATVGLWQLG